MKRCFAIVVLCAAMMLAPVVPAEANPDEIPYLCGPEDLPEPGSAVTLHPVPGTYECSAEGITIRLRLDADGHFVQSAVSHDPEFDGPDGNFLDGMNLSGRWEAEGEYLRLFRRPSRPPRLTLASATRDPSVHWRIEIRTPDGEPARGLYVGLGEEANPRASLDDGVQLEEAGYDWSPGLRSIVREGDDLRLGSFSATDNGPNSFRYVYHPSEVEPFEIYGEISGVSGQWVIVPLGISGAVLRRTGPEK
ncbi:hypothetical protein [Novosphingobium beihaiensis]|uniref:Secreted protein n=1 Tax=Novosphingobium beihaiensis TaxID=2930389 RepID=A0ABT0BMV3_9SPHN|nr:hypothetical protein [Novosphingobium beihaiensis]MCJ2186379.1 hypothetical protein [Novosphingobium beihaiensis]